MQKELREVNKNLKFNPTDTVMLSQKQKLLAESITNTKNKLETLKEAERQAEEQFKEGKISEEQYRALQREISKTENQLNSLEREYNNCGNSASASFEKASQGLGKVSNVSGKVYDVGKKVSTGIIGIGTAAATSSIQFEDSMAKVSTIMDTNVMSTDEMKKKIIELSNQTGISADAIAEDVYNAISAGQKTGDAINFVTNSTKLAKAGFAESSQTLDVLTTTLNAYGMKATDVTKVSDILIQTQNLGKTTVAELASSMGKVIPTANANKVSLEQLASGYALMTSKGIATAETTTYMNSMFNELGKSGTNASNALKAATGSTFPELMKSGKSVGDVLNSMSDYAKKNGKSLADMFGSAEAGKAALVLSNNAGKDFDATLGKMNKSAGSTDTAFKKMSTTGSSFKKSINEMKNAGIKLGDALGPVIQVIAKHLKTLADKLSGLSQNQLLTLIKAGGFIVAITGIAGAVSKITGALSGVSNGIAKILMHKQGILSGITAIKGVVVKLFSVIMANPIVAIISGVIIAIVLLWNKCEWFRNAVMTIFNALKVAFQAICTFFKTAFSAVFDFFKPIVQGFVVFFKAAWELIKAAFELVAGVFKQVWTVLWTVLKAIFTPIIAYFKLEFELYKKAFEVVCNALKTIWNAIWTAIKAIFTPIINNIKTAWNGLKSAFETVCNGLKSAWSTLWNAIKTIFTPIINNIKTAWNGLKGAFNSVCNGLKSVWNGLCNTLKSVWNKVVDGIKNAWNKITSPFKKVVDTIKGIWNGLKLKFPDIKLPHFKLSGEFSLKKMTVPHISIDWYSQGGIFKQPTILANGIGVGDMYNGKGSNAEAVVPLDELWEHIDKLVNSNKGINQVNNFYSKESISPGEYARKTKQALREILV